MPKATLTFNLPEEREEYETATQGAGWKFALDDIMTRLRTMIKYEEVHPKLEELYKYAWDCLEDRGLKLWD